MSNPQKRLETLLGHLRGGQAAVSAHTTSSSVPRYRYTSESSAAVLSPGQRSFYEENGYLVIPALVSKEKLDAYRERFVKICNGETKVHVLQSVSIKRSKDKIILEAMFVPCNPSNALRQT